MKVVLINPNYQSFASIEQEKEKARIFLPREISECLGLGYLATALEENDIDCKIVDADLLNLEDNEVLEICNTYQPNLIGITFLHDTFPQGLKLLRLLKKNIPVPIVVGGHLPTIAGEYLLNLVPEIDYIIIGEAESSLIDFINAFNPPKKPLEEVPNLIFRLKSSGIIRTRLSLAPKLDHLAFPLRYNVEHIFSLQKKLSLPKALRFLMSRGCKRKCQFCSIYTFYQSSKSSPCWRARSIENLFEEISILKNIYGVNYFYFSDDDFIGSSNHQHQRIKSFAQVLKNVWPDSLFSISCRIDGFNFEVFELLKEAGLMHVGVGLENINNNALSFLQKGYLNTVIIPFIEGMEQLDVSVTFFMILYHPLATIKEVYQNYIFLQNLGYFEGEIGKRNAYDCLLTSRLLVRRFTPMESRLSQLGLLEDYSLKNPFFVKYKFVHPEVGMFWNDLYYAVNNNEQQMERIFLDIINHYLKKY